MNKKLLRVSISICILSVLLIASKLKEENLWFRSNWLKHKDTKEVTISVVNENNEPQTINMKKLDIKNLIDSLNIGMIYSDITKEDTKIINEIYKIKNNESINIKLNNGKYMYIYKTIDENVYRFDGYAFDRNGNWLIQSKKINEIFNFYNSKV